MVTAIGRADYNPTMSEPVFRFAPSPNGHLHLGHALSALVTWESARAMGGRFLLRMEDIDIERCRPEYERQMLDDLEWLGLEWETPVRRQSEHFETYQKAASRLEQAGLLYPCFATRKEIAEHAREAKSDPDGAPLYPGLHKGLSTREVAARKAADEPFALRINMQKALEQAGEMGCLPLAFETFNPKTGETGISPADPGLWGDAVITRKEVPTSYHLSVVVDDALQGVTHVVRGKDLLAATDLHRLLQVLLGLDAPKYHHHALLTDEEGRKLSKSARDKSIASLRAEGATANDIRRMAGIAQS